MLRCVRFAVALVTVASFASFTAGCSSKSAVVNQSAVTNFASSWGYKAPVAPVAPATPTVHHPSAASGANDASATNGAGKEGGAPTPPAREVATFRFDQFAEHYGKNPLAADKQFVGQRFRLIGIVSKIDSVSGKPFAVLGAFAGEVGSNYETLCYFAGSDAELLKLKIPTASTIEGTMEERDGNNFILKNCRVIPDPPGVNR